MNNRTMLFVVSAITASTPSFAANPPSTGAVAAAHVAATGGAAASPTIDEKSIMNTLQSQAFIDFNSYRRDPDGGAMLQALDGRSGKLDTITVDKNGKISMQPGWLLTQAPHTGNG